MGFVMLLRARGKERVEPLGKANTHALRPHLRGQGSLEKGMTKTHILVRARRHAGQSDPRFQNGY